MNEQEIQIIKEKINFFYQRCDKVHVKLLNKEFRNGTIVDQGATFLILKEISGLETPVFLSEIFDITPYVEREEK